MRAHGDEYKTNAALSNPIKNKGKLEGESEFLMGVKPKRYSCPQEGCRWNQKHAKFQPLKSMICAKNHYKRSHCPKMYVCKRCNQKQFSVLSDLRTHEKHCGDLKWQCSCGTSFSRKDKLMGHVALFVGHQPLINNNVGLSSYSAKLEHHTLQMQIDAASRWWCSYISRGALSPTFTMLLNKLVWEKTMYNKFNFLCKLIRKLINSCLLLIL